MRVYLPATLAVLAGWYADAAATVLGPAYAVTPAVREWYREGDSDELEHVAQLAAARGSVELLAHDLDVPRRRVVLAADVELATPWPDGLDPNVFAPGASWLDTRVSRAAVRLSSPVPATGWACVLVDEPDAAAVVASAVASLARAAIGDEDAGFALDEADAHELGWYAVQEIPDLLAG